MRSFKLSGETFLEAANRRRNERETNAAANAIKKAKRDAAAMTCQCCAGKILANTGVIAHHGYQRPGDGWQTASCFGARRLPFEVDRTALGELIVALKNQLAARRSALRDIQAETYPISRKFTDYNVPRPAYGSERPSVELKFTRANFDALLVEHAKLLRSHSHAHTFDELKQSEINSAKLGIKHVQKDIANCQRRFDGWKQTHEAVLRPDTLLSNRFIEWKAL